MSDDPISVPRPAGNAGREEEDAADAAENAGAGPWAGDGWCAVIVISAINALAWCVIVGMCLYHH